MAAEVMSGLGEPTVGVEAKNLDDGVTSVASPELTTGAAQVSVDNKAMPRNTALVAIFLLQYLQYQIVSFVPRNEVT